MVRTAGIRISAARSSKKVSGKITPSTQTSSATKSGSSSSKLPPIPYQETPSWQKPITNFFKSERPLKAKENKSEEESSNNVTDDTDAGTSKKKLKMDNPDTNSKENRFEVKEDEVEESERGDSEKISETDKENMGKSAVIFDEGAGSSKD